MPNREKILDNVAQLAGGTAGIVSGLGRNIREEIKTRVNEIVDRLDLVPREDLLELETRLNAALKEQEDLKLRIEKLENKKK